MVRGSWTTAVALRVIGFGFEGTVGYRTTTDACGCSRGVIDSVATMARSFGIGAPVENGRGNALPAVLGFVRPSDPGNTCGAAGAASSWNV
jgi:hypothetical protein